jgi:hypothetical protein
LTFRSEKRHRAQESSRSKKSLPKLAAKLQHFANTGKVAKQDLKEIDRNMQLFLQEKGGKCLNILDQLRERTPPAKGKDVLELACNRWAKWVSDITSKPPAGYASVKEVSGDARSTLFEECVDADADLSGMLISFASSLSESIKKSSYQLPGAGELSKDVEEIVSAYDSREKLMERLSTEV